MIVYFSIPICFNPCFNGFMDKDKRLFGWSMTGSSFNPCFNGFMDKDICSLFISYPFMIVSTLVLMDSWIKTAQSSICPEVSSGFNPCFNGFMDKDSTETNVLD